MFLSVPLLVAEQAHHNLDTRGIELSLFYLFTNLRYFKYILSVITAEVMVQ